MNLEFNFNKRGLDTIFKDYQKEALLYLWKQTKAVGSRQVWEHVNQNPDIKISRASIINFLNAMVEYGILTSTTKTGKGGHRAIYQAKFTKSQSIEQIIQYIIQTLYRDFKKETTNVLKKYQYTIV